MTASELALEGLPLFMRGLLRIPVHLHLLRELRMLERRTHRSGRDTIGHPANGSDDIANSLFGAMRLTTVDRPRGGWGTIGPLGDVHLHVERRQVLRFEDELDPALIAHRAALLAEAISRRDESVANFAAQRERANLRRR